MPFLTWRAVLTLIGPLLTWRAAVPCSRWSLANFQAVFGKRRPDSARSAALGKRKKWG